jgi:hypothetical protein
MSSNAKYDAAYSEKLDNAASCEGSSTVLVFLDKDRHYYDAPWLTFFRDTEVGLEQAKRWMKNSVEERFFHYGRKSNKSFMVDAGYDEWLCIRRVPSGAKWTKSIQRRSEVLFSAETEEAREWLRKPDAWSH